MNSGIHVSDASMNSVLSNLGLSMHVKNSFLEFECSSDPKEYDQDGDGVRHENGSVERGADGETDASGSKSSPTTADRKGLWLSMKARRDRMRANSVGTGMDRLSSRTASSSSECSEQSSVSITACSPSPVSTASNSMAPSPRVQAKTGEDCPANRRSESPALPGQASVAGSQSQSSTSSAAGSTSASVSKLAKKHRLRPPKPVRDHAKELAKMLFDVQDASDEKRETAACFFAAQTQGNIVLYDYTMYVLSSMRRDINEDTLGDADEAVQ